MSATGGGAAPLACRGCGTALHHAFLDLGVSPPANSYLPAERADEPELFHPLRVFVCERCFLVQLPEVVAAADIFGHYAYFASFSDSWLEHAERYAEQSIERFGLKDSSRVIEVASNDGYLLRCFAKRGIPVLGIEPAANVAAAAVEAGIPTVVEFFGRATAEALVQEGRRADLLVANNVLAHVPALNDFVAGLAALLAEEGVLTLEFPHLMQLIQQNQFDTIYHEHYSYFALGTVVTLFARHGLEVFDVEELPTHGGSLRVYARREADPKPRGEGRVAELLAREEAAGLRRLDTYAAFAERVEQVKRGLLRFLIEAREAGRSVVGYGAPAKGNTLLNYCGIGTDFLDYTVDRSPHKQGCLLPGTRIPIHAPERIRETRPDYVLILPWNLEREIVEQMAEVRSWGGRFVVPIPGVRVVA